MKKYRKHIRYHFDTQVSLKRNLIGLLKAAYPTELTLEKLKNPLAFEDNSLSKPVLDFCNVTVSLTDSHRYLTSHMDNATHIGLDISRYFNDRYKRTRKGATNRTKILKIDKVRGISITQFKEYFDKFKVVVQEKIKLDEVEKQKNHIISEKLNNMKALFNTQKEHYYIYTTSSSTPDNTLYNITLYNLNEDDLQLLSMFVNKTFGGVRGVK